MIAAFNLKDAAAEHERYLEIKKLLETLGKRDSRASWPAQVTFRFQLPYHTSWEDATLKVPLEVVREVIQKELTRSEELLVKLGVEL